MELGTKEFNDSAMEMFGGKPKQQTAVEWFANAIKGLDTSVSYYFFQEMLEQAKEMEKQQGYSEEEVIQLVSDWNDYRMSEDAKSKVTFKKWFEQFKNK